MTPVNERLKAQICVYCANCVENGCEADVPWYLATIYCKHYAEERPRPLPVKRRRRVDVRKYLVETF